MNKELFRTGNKKDIQELKKRVIRSKLTVQVKKDFMEYLTSDEKTNLDMLRVLIFDFLSAETAIENARQCNDIGEWVRVVVDGLQPSVKGYTNQQINLALALILYEKSVRTSEYNDIFGRFTEIYQEKGKVY